MLALASLSVVSSSFVSCSESMGLSGVTLSNKKISFTATEVNGWTPNSGSSSNDESSRAVGSYHPLLVKSDLGKSLYLHPVEQAGTYFYNDKDELVTHSGVPLSEINNHNDKGTRGTIVTNINTALGVSAVWNDENGNSSQYFLDKEAALSNSNNVSTWHTDEDLFWATNGTLDFYAYAPYSGISSGMLSVPNDGSDDANKVLNAQTVHYVASQADIENQPDFIVAKNTNNSFASTDAAKAVNLHFSHALTAITFSVGNDMVLGTVKSVAIRNVKGKGDYNISTGQWTLSSDLSDYEIPLGADGNGIDIETGVAKALTTDPLTLMMIPQKFDANSTTEVEIVFDNGAGDRTLSAELKGTEWKAGYTINYKLSANSITTLNLGDVTFPTSWSSNINATATNKLKSAYANGDQIGLFVVDENNKVRDANIAITYNSSTSVWALPTGETYKFSPQYTYFAYYPYQSSLTGLPDVNTTVDVSNATTFFSSAISTWETSKLVSDQSTLAKLNACDLHIGKATFDNTASKINFASMSHTMSLAEVTLTTRNDCNCELYSDASYTWVGPVPASENFGTNKPFKVTNYQYTNNKFVEIIKSNTEAEFSGGKNEYGVWSLSIPAIEPNAIGSGSSVLDKKQRFALELGDMYYEDGALTHQSEDLASDKTAIGVVGYIAKGDGSDNCWVEKNTGSGHGGHALVMGLRTIGSTKTTDPGTLLRWCTFSSETSQHKQSVNDIKNSSNQTYGSGYKTTSGFWNSNSYPAFVTVKNYTTFKAPADKCTGWFIATAGQYYAVFDQLGGGMPSNWTSFISYVDNGPTITAKVNKALSKAGTDKYTDFCQLPIKLSNSDVYVEWTSSEANTVSSVTILSGYFRNNIIGSFSFNYNSGASRNDNPCVVRPFLAF